MATMHISIADPECQVPHELESGMHSRISTDGDLWLAGYVSYIIRSSLAVGDGARRVGV